MYPSQEFSSTAQNNFKHNNNENQKRMCGSYSPEKQSFFNKQDSFYKYQSDNGISKISVLNPIPKISVQNICNQIKYLIQGNLLNTDLNIDKTEIVRDSIIPTLIRMFFQSQEKLQINKNNYVKHEEKIKKMNSTVNSLSQQIKLLQDYRNSFISTNNKDDSNLVFKQSFQNFKDSKMFIEGNKSKNSFISNLSSDDKENINQFGQKKKCQSKYQKYQCGDVNKIKNDDVKSEISEIQLLPEIFCLGMLLIKTCILNKASAFHKIKSFVKAKDKSIRMIINLMNQAKIKICVQKFKKHYQENQMYQNIKKIKTQQNKFKQKTYHLSCQLLARYLKKKIKQNFQIMVNNCLQENKWMGKWVRFAALRSPVTLKTSIWRLKSFMKKQEQEDKLNQNNNVQNNQVLSNIKNSQQQNPKEQTIKDKSIKSIKSIEKIQNRIINVKLQIQQGNSQPSLKYLNQNQKQNIPLKKQQLSSSFISQSQQYSISSKQYEQMFKNQEEEGQLHEQSRENYLQQKQEEQKITQNNDNQNMLVQDEDDEYLRTISQEQDQN